MEIKVVIFSTLLCFASCGVIIPGELPSALSVVFPYIPQIKKGTDSRLGFGFAFGNHADFQVMLELGPQTDTMKLTGQPFPKNGNSNSKRQAPSPPPVEVNKNENKSDVGKYLQKPGDIKNLEETAIELVKNENGEYKIHQPKPGRMPQKVFDTLKKFYSQKNVEARKLVEKKRSNAEIKKITEDLSNVDLD